MGKIYEYALTKNTDELKKLIEQYPDYPIVVLAGEEANSNGEFYYMYCSDIRFSVKEILIADYDNSGFIYSDRDEFEEKVRTDLEDFEGSDEEYEKAIKETLAKYEPYWKKVIAICADN